MLYKLVQVILFLLSVGSILARILFLSPSHTPLSFFLLQSLMVSQEGWKPAKYFSIDRVFRNEAMDACHLCEFHQIEGLICDKSSLSHSLYFILLPHVTFT
jgi:phenylalanyl-tRNA synthetase alpha chain